VKLFSDRISCFRVNKIRNICVSFALVKQNPNAFTIHVVLLVGLASLGLELYKKKYIFCDKIIIQQ